MMENWQRYLESTLWTLPLFALIYTLAEVARPLNRNFQLMKRSEKPQDFFWLVSNELILPTLTDYLQRMLFFVLGLVAFIKIQDFFHFKPIHIENRFVLFLILFLLRDLMYYWTHWVIHNSWLWRFHMLHHSSVKIDWLSGFRGYWFDNIVFNVGVQIPFLFFEYDAQMIWIFVLIDTQMTYFIHTNTDFPLGPLRYIFNHPVVHHIHHMVECKYRGGQNFGAYLLIWDRVFGTFHEVSDLTKETYGLPEKLNYPKTILARALYPFKKH